MDQEKAAKRIAKFMRWAVCALKSYDEEAEEYCNAYDHSGLCHICGTEISGSDWAWTGHCSRYCAVTVRDRRECRF